MKQIIKWIILRGLLHNMWVEQLHSWIYVKSKEKMIQKWNKPIFDKREQLYDYIIHNALSSQSIDFLEFGVFEGESLNYWVQHVTQSDAAFYGFDSFEGLPEDWTPDKPKGTFATKGQPPPITDSRVNFIIGLFTQTLPSFLKNYSNTHKTKIVHMDADLYSSTLFVLVQLLPTFKKGDIIIFDEFAYPVLSEYKAFQDFQEIAPFNFESIAATNNFHQIAIKITDVSVT